MQLSPWKPQSLWVPGSVLTLSSWIHAGTRKWKFFTGDDECLSVPQNWQWASLKFNLMQLFVNVCRVMYYLTSQHYMPVALQEYYCVEVPCHLPPASGFSLTPEALRDPSIWDKLWWGLKQVKTLYSRTGTTPGWSIPLLSWKRKPIGPESHISRVYLPKSGNPPLLYA